MSKYAEIIELLEKSTGPSRWLDARIDAALRIGTEKMRAGGYEWAWDNFPVWARHMQAAGMCGVMHTNGDLGLIWDSERFTASIDCAVALSESVVALEGRKLICFFCAGGQLTPYNADETSPDYHPRAKVDNSVTVGWMAHVRFYNADGSSEGAEDYSHGKTAPISILLALFRALEAKEAG